jgi:hypothetical protein
MAPPKSVIPMLGKICQAFVLLNDRLTDRQHENRAILGFFEFGTPPAVCPASRDGPGKHQMNLERRPAMFAIDTSNRLFAAAFSLVLSAAAIAYAIIPASPSLVA